MTTQTQMNTLTPTEAHLDLALQIAEAIACSGNVAAAQLIADSEARAVAVAVTMLTCTNHNDKQRAACPVCLVAALTAERDQLRAELATERAIVSRIWTQLGSTQLGSATYEQLRGRSIYDLIDELKANATSSAPRWKREREWQAGIIAHAQLHHAERKEAIARAERAEAKLERLRLELKGAAASST